MLFFHNVRVISSYSDRILTLSKGEGQRKTVFLFINSPTKNKNDRDAQAIVCVFLCHRVMWIVPLKSLTITILMKFLRFPHFFRIDEKRIIDAVKGKPQIVISWNSFFTF